MKPERVAEIIGDHIDESEVVSERRIHAVTDRDRYRDALLTLRKQDFQHLTTISGTDIGDEIELIYHVDCGDGVLLDLAMSIPKDSLEVQTVTDIYPGAILYERELMDLLGVEVKDHPDPRRLLLSDDWPDGKYPLRREDMEEQGK